VYNSRGGGREEKFDQIVNLVDLNLVLGENKIFCGFLEKKGKFIQSENLLINGIDADVGAS
jgi:hypothetical protein